MRGLTVTFAVSHSVGITFRCTSGLAIALAVVCGFEIIVPCINAEYFLEMMNEQDFELDVEEITDVDDYEWDASLPSYLNKTEESNTK